MTQVTGSLVLLVVTTQLPRFFVLLAANPGFRRAREVPGVKSAAFTYSLPMAITMLAAAVPARRAARIELIQALRQD